MMNEIRLSIRILSIHALKMFLNLIQTFFNISEQSRNYDKKSRHYNKCDKSKHTQQTPRLGSFSFKLDQLSDWLNF